MRNIFCAIMAVTAVSACTTAPEEPEVDLRGEASASCIDNRDWAYSVNRGEVVYQENCDYCHRDDGRGQPGKVPALVGNDSLLADPARGIRLILITKADPKPMHGMAVEDLVAIFEDLSLANIADVLTYARASWGNCASRVSESDVEAIAETT